MDEVKKMVPTEVLDAIEEATMYFRQRRHLDSSTEDDDDSSTTKQHFEEEGDHVMVGRKNKRRRLGGLECVGIAIMFDFVSINCRSS